MHPAPLFSAAPLRQPLLRAASVLLLGAFASAHAASDGLLIYGSTQWAAIGGRVYTYTPRVTNPSGRALTFGIVHKPHWATLNTKTGQLHGTPPAVAAVYSNIAISVSAEYRGQTGDLWHSGNQGGRGQCLRIPTHGPRLLRSDHVLLGEKQARMG